jgi:hypothetical protein
MERRGWLIGGHGTFWHLRFSPIEEGGGLRTLCTREEGEEKGKELEFETSKVSQIEKREFFDTLFDT